MMTDYPIYENDAAIAEQFLSRSPDNSHNNNWILLPSSGIQMNLKFCNYLTKCTTVIGIRKQKYDSILMNIFQMKPGTNTQSQQETTMWTRLKMILGSKEPFASSDPNKQTNNILPFIFDN